jgi:hypothetical protein
MSAFFSRFKGKKGTSTDFGGKKTDRSQIKASLPEPATEPTIQPPVKDKDATTETERANADNEAESAAGRKQQADHQVKPPAVQSSKQAKASETPDGTYTTTDLSGKDSYQQFWAPEVPYDFIPVQHPRVNYWTPNATSLFRAIDITHDLVNNTKFVQQQAVNYIPYAVDCYYSALFYRQILRAKRASSTLSGNEKTLLTRWEKTFPDEKLPIAKPFYPFFSSIIACELEDRKYDWNVPYVPAALFKANRRDAAIPQDFLGSEDFDSSNGLAFSLPMFPYMIGNLNYLISQTAVTVQARIGNDDIYTPLDINTATANIFNRDIPNNAATGANMKRIFSASGYSQPVLIANENIGASLKQAKRTDFYNDIKFAPEVPNPNPRQLVNRVPLSNLDEFLFMTKENNLRWFDLLLTNAITHARFFGTPENMSTVPTVGGLETCVVGRYKRDNRDLDQQYFDSLSFGTTAHVSQWYPTTLKQVSCGFATNRAGTSRRESFQAFAFAANALPPIRLVANTDLQGFRTGALYDNTEWNETYAYENDEFGKPMFVSWNSVVRNMFNEKPGPSFE